MNKYVERIRSLPLSNGYHKVDVSHFIKLSFDYKCYKGYGDRTEASYSHKIVPDEKMQLKLTDDFSRCQMILDFDTSDFQISCYFGLNEVCKGMQIINCINYDTILVRPNWNDEISYVTSRKLILVQELAELCSNNSNFEVESVH